MRMISFWRGVGRLGAACGLVLTAMFMAGCKSDSSSRFAEMPGITGPALAHGVSTNADSILDVFHANDSVQVTFNDLPTPVQPVTDQIKEDGTITLLQNQTFNVEGKSRAQIEKEIRDRYVPAFFQNLTVSFQHAAQSRFYYVGGEVKQPGRQIFITKLTIRGAIQSAGDFTDFANKRKVELKRSNGTKFTVNCNKARNNSTLDLPVYPDDIIYVPRRPF